MFSKCSSACCTSISSTSAIVLALEADLQRLAIEAMPLAHRAGDPHVGQKVHLQPVRAVAFAGFAATAGHVEAEPAFLVAAGFRLGQLRVQLANVVEHLDVGGRVRARRAADRRLIDGDQLVEMLEPFDPLVIARLAFAAVQIAAQGLDQDVVDQRAFARAGNAGHADQRPERNLDVDVLADCCAGADDLQPVLAAAAGAGREWRSAACPDRYCPVRLRWSRGDLVGRAAGHDFAAADARARARSR